MYPYYRTLEEDIANAINGEYSAIQCYKKLAQLAPNETERNRILEIRRDEKKHFKAFKAIYTQLTGQEPSPQLIEECPTEYKAGLDASVNDEQIAADFYRRVADQTNNLFIKETFIGAALDEQNHAVWFLYFLTKRR